MRSEMEKGLLCLSRNLAVTDSYSVIFYADTFIPNPIISVFT